MFRSCATGSVLETPVAAGHRRAQDAGGRRAASRWPTCSTRSASSHPGAITLHNYPQHLQNLTRDNGERFDLAAVDILRDRERGVPRYNQFRRLVHKEPVTSFDEITDNPAVARADQAGLRQRHREGGPDDRALRRAAAGRLRLQRTAFRIFVLMASRRLKSDRFFTDDYGAELYTEFGIDYIRKTTMLTLLERHVPELKPALRAWRTRSRRGNRSAL